MHYLGDEENRRVTPSPEVHLHIFTALDWLYMHSFIGYEPYCSLCSIGLNCMILGDEENRSDSHWYFMISVTSYFWWMKPCISFRWIVALLLLHFIWYTHELNCTWCSAIMVPEISFCYWIFYFLAWEQQYHHILPGPLFVSVSLPLWLAHIICDPCCLFSAPWSLEQSGILLLW